MNKMNIKSIVVVLLLVVLISISSVFHIFAISSEFLITANKTTVKRGETVTLTVKTRSINEVKGGFNAYSGTLYYDSSQLSRNVVESSVPLWSFALNPANNKFVSTDGSGMDFKKLDLNVMSIELAVLDSAPLGATEIKLSDLRITDGAFTNIVLPDAKITINIEDKGAVEVPKSSNNKLGSLSLSGIPLSPSFSADTLTYTMSVENSVSDFILSATTQDSKAVIVSGTGAKILKEGNNTFTVVTKAEDGTLKTYTINVNRKGSTPVVEKSKDDSLKALTVTDGKNNIPLSPSFSSSNTNYTASVGKDVSSIDVSGLLNDPKSTIVSGGGNHVLKEGTNVISVVVRAEDGTEKTYKITVEKPKADANGGDTGAGDTTGGNNSNGGDTGAGGTTGGNNTNGGNTGGDNTNGGNTNGDININNNNSSQSSNNFVVDLQGLGNLNQPFDKNTMRYSSTVSTTVEKLDLHITLEDPNARYEIMGHDSIKPGMNQVIVRVIAVNNEVRDYVIDVLCTDQVNSTLLSSISVGGYAINPGFREDVMFYTLYVTDQVSTLGVSATSKYGGATINISGNDRLHSGLNYIKIVVSANGQMNTYVVEVIKEHVAPKVNYTPWIIAGISGFIAIVLLILLAFKSRSHHIGMAPQYIPMPAYYPQGNQYAYPQYGGPQYPSGSQEEPDIKRNK